ncbi:MAG: [Fe-S]-binding protein [Candidatus Rokubacteria bacterium]|nr:[Fe-S]-binding protein [Candidatus Rokubacteria bacterium]MBI3825316.1 [Fe-S]-binding protein [Candidatus Rokubacteria bacterium]
MALPRMLRVRQNFPRPRVADIPRTVTEALGGAALTIKRGDVVAVGAGSRGVANIDVIVGATVRWLKELGARPFVFPAMGSHGGGTPEGQCSVLEHYGITEATMGCPVRATMEVVPVGEALGMPVWLDRYASQADWIGIVNRVKPHTDFKGSIESGLFKMMTIGLGKYKGAIQYHRANIQHGYEKVITSVGREMLATAKIAFGVGIVENGYDETARIEAFDARHLEEGERRLLKDAREWMARLPFPAFDVLIVEEMGKNVSGSGMDSNVIGRPTNPHEPFPNEPRILWIVTLDLTEESYGNATGIGNADFTTRRLVDKIDMKATLINCITACSPGGAKVPATYETDREAVETALSCIGLTPPEKARVVRIKNTLMIGELDVSEALLPDAGRRGDLTELGDLAPLPFDAAGRLVPFDGGRH